MRGLLLDGVIRPMERTEATHQETMAPTFYGTYELMDGNEQDMARLCPNPCR